MYSFIESTSILLISSTKMDLPYILRIKPWGTFPGRKPFMLAFLLYDFSFSSNFD